MDLHGLSRPIASAAVFAALEDLECKYWQEGSLRHGLSIVTGAGNNSDGGASVLKPHIVELLALLDPPLQPKIATGKLQVHHSQLLAWMKLRERRWTRGTRGAKVIEDGRQRSEAAQG